jgi:hypothetical protein
MRINFGGLAYLLGDYIYISILVGNIFFVLFFVGLVVFSAISIYKCIKENIRIYRGDERIDSYIIKGFRHVSMMRLLIISYFVLISTSLFYKLQLTNLYIEFDSYAFALANLDFFDIIIRHVIDHSLYHLLLYVFCIFTLVKLYEYSAYSRHLFIIYIILGLIYTFVSGAQLSQYDNSLLLAKTTLIDAISYFVCGCLFIMSFIVLPEHLETNAAVEEYLIINSTDD